eukprot:2307552-Pyramimonas_sp.AAC.1
MVWEAPMSCHRSVTTGGGGFLGPPSPPHPLRMHTLSDPAHPSPGPRGFQPLRARLPLWESDH